MPLIKPISTRHQLTSRMGVVGSIEAWDLTDAHESRDHAMWLMSKIARLSHGLDEAEDYRAHFNRVVHQLHHVSVAEFVPAFGLPKGHKLHLPAASMRHHMEQMVDDETFYRLSAREWYRPMPQSTAFVVDAPIFVARQWMRHRSFAYLEMSRRYVKGSRIPWTFYGGETDYHQACIAEYDRRIASGMPAELARGCMPVEAMTRFWVAGFDRDWETFCDLRCDSHAQPEIRVFADHIRGII